MVLNSGMIVIHIRKIWPDIYLIFSRTDFRQQAGSLLSVRGENILSRALEDDFLSEDKATGVQEVC